MSVWDISDKYFTSITPIWYTFSIWMLIYIAWISLWLLNAFKIEKVSWHYIALSWAIISILGWIIAWQLEYFFLSLVFDSICLYLLFSTYLYKENKKYFEAVLEIFLWWMLVSWLATLHIFLLAQGWYFSPLFLTIFSLSIWICVTLFYVFYKDTHLQVFVYFWALQWIFTQQESIIIRCIILFNIITVSLALIINKYITKYQIKSIKPFKILKWK